MKIVYNQGRFFCFSALTERIKHNTKAPNICCNCRNAKFVLVAHKSDIAIQIYNRKRIFIYLFGLLLPKLQDKIKAKGNATYNASWFIKSDSKLADAANHVHSRIILSFTVYISFTAISLVQKTSQ